MRRAVAHLEPSLCDRRLALASVIRRGWTTVGVMSDDLRKKLRQMTASDSKQFFDELSVSEVAETALKALKVCYSLAMGDGQTGAFLRRF